MVTSERTFLENLRFHLKDLYCKFFIVQITKYDLIRLNLIQHLPILPVYVL